MREFVAWLGFSDPSRERLPKLITPSHHPVSKSSQLKRMRAERSAESEAPVHPDRLRFGGFLILILAIVG